MFTAKSIGVLIISMTPDPAHLYQAEASLARETDAESLFAVRSGGRSGVADAATVKGGVLIDLRAFNKVISLERHDEPTMFIGAG